MRPRVRGGGMFDAPTFCESVLVVVALILVHGEINGM